MKSLLTGLALGDGALEPRARAFAFPLRTSARYLESSNGNELRAKANRFAKLSTHFPFHLWTKLGITWGKSQKYWGLMVNNLGIKVHEFHKSCHSSGMTLSTNCVHKIVGYPKAAPYHNVNVDRLHSPQCESFTLTQ